MPALDPNHDHRAPARAAVLTDHPALAGHAAFEVYAVLTRLPVPLRLSARQASDVVREAFPARCWLTPQQSDELLDRVAGLGLVGGSVHDARPGRPHHREGAAPRCPARSSTRQGP